MSNLETVSEVGEGSDIEDEANKEVEKLMIKKMKVELKKLSLN